VPLWIRIPELDPRVIDTQVSLMDLGPTILDLMGAATPGSFMGQSLVPALRGLPLELSRPLGAEGRLKQALVFPDGIKAVRDQRTYTQEVYDLNNDPGETNNLVESADPKYLREVDAFFDENLHSDYGSTAPYRN
jgi:choline-sulfatase